MWNEIADYVPNDHPGQVTAEWMVKRVLDKLPPKPVIVDVGCGAGNSVDFFRSLLPDCEWIGVDIAESPEIRQRKRTDAKFLEFDGVNIPLPDNSTDLVFSRQVLEAHLCDIRRIIKREGFVIGQTSHLEPYHSFQYWNFTPWGFKVIAPDAGFELTEIRPGIDGLTLVKRTYDGRPKSYGKYFNEESPLNSDIDNWAVSTSRSTKQRLIRKLSVSGQFCFILERAS